MKYKAIVFDLDDTLISEIDYIKSGYREVSKYLSELVSIDQVKIYQELLYFFKKSSKNVFNKFFESINYEYTNDDINALIEIYRNHYPNLSLYDDVIPTLNELKKRGYQLGIITDGYAITQQRKVEALNLDKYVDHIIITDLLGREFWKPHSLPFKIMRDKMGIKFEEMVYVGDNPRKDFYIKAGFPITTVRITREQSFYKNNPYLKGYKEDISIKKLEELLTIFR